MSLADKYMLLDELFEYKGNLETIIKSATVNFQDGDALVFDFFAYISGEISVMDNYSASSFAYTVYEDGKILEEFTAQNSISFNVKARSNYKVYAHGGGNNSNISFLLRGEIVPKNPIGIAVRSEE